MTGYPLEIEEQEAGDLPINSIFIYQSAMYVVLRESDDENFLLVKQMAAGWRKNPDDRWLLSEGVQEKFNGYCSVGAFLFPE